MRTQTQAKAKPQPSQLASPEKLTIGRLAQIADVGVETIRYYERRGLIQQPRATSGAFRVYPADTIRRIHFIRRAKELGFTLSEIAELLSLADKPTAKRSALKAYTGQKIADIERKIHDLTQIQQTLQKLMKACSGRGPLMGCPILEALQTDTESTKSSHHDHCGDDRK